MACRPYFSLAKWANTRYACRMFSWRGFAVALALGSAALAGASYEMALLLHYHQDRMQISRWDAPTGRYLGSFGGNLGLSSLGIGLDHPSNGSVVTGVQGVFSYGYRRIDYSTGANLGARTIPYDGWFPSRFAASPSGHLMFAVNDGVNRQVHVRDANMNLLRSLNSPGSIAIMDMVRGEDGTFYTLARSAGSSSGTFIYVDSYAPGNSNPVSRFGLLDNSTVIPWNSLALRGNSLIVGGDQTANSEILNANGTSLSYRSPVYGYFISSSSILFGHEDSIYSFGYNAGANRMELGSGSLAGDGIWSRQYNGSGTFASSALYGGTMVLAPEPGTMIAVGTGFLALMLRRRRN